MFLYQWDVKNWKRNCTIIAVDQHPRQMNSIPFSYLSWTYGKACDASSLHASMGVLSLTLTVGFSPLAIAITAVCLSTGAYPSCHTCIPSKVLGSFIKQKDLVLTSVEWAFQVYWREKAQLVATPIMSCIPTRLWFVVRSRKKSIGQNTFKLVYDKEVTLTEGLISIQAPLCKFLRIQTQSGGPCFTMLKVNLFLC